jgi:hypothetical protein
MDTLTTCTGILVRHADGSHDCDHAGTCGTDLLVHDWVLDCADTSCDCGHDAAADLGRLVPIAA